VFLANKQISAYVRELRTDHDRPGITRYGLGATLFLLVSALVTFDHVDKITSALAIVVYTGCIGISVVAWLIDFGVATRRVRKDVVWLNAWGSDVLLCAVDRVASGKSPEVTFRQFAHQVREIDYSFSEAGQMELDELSFPVVEIPSDTPAKIHAVGMGVLSRLESGTYPANLDVPWAMVLLRAFGDHDTQTALRIFQESDLIVASRYVMGALLGEGVITSTKATHTAVLDYLFAQWPTWWESRAYPGPVHLPTPLMLALCDRVPGVASATIHRQLGVHTRLLTDYLDNRFSQVTDDKELAWTLFHDHEERPNQISVDGLCETLAAMRRAAAQVH
jgi:hypothetical protein